MGRKFNVFRGLNVELEKKTTPHDKLWWKNWCNGELYSPDKEKTVLIAIEPPYQIPSSAVIGGKQRDISISHICCMEHDPHYKHGFRCFIGGLVCWLDETQIAFAVASSAIERMVAEAIIDTCDD